MNALLEIPQGLAPQHCSCGSGDSGTDSSAAPPSFVYSIGKLRSTAPSVSAAQAFNQVVGSLNTSVPDFALPYQVYSQDSSIWLTKDLCWIFEVGASGYAGAIDTYLVRPRSFRELYGMVSSLAPNEQVASTGYDVIIGPRGPLSSPQMCQGVQLPLVVCNQLYSFTYADFVAAIVARTGVPADDAGSMFYTMTRIPDNAGQTDEHRALNYVTLRYPDIYTMASNMLGHGTGPYLSNGVYTLSHISARPASVQGTRRITDIIFHYISRLTPAKVDWYCEVDTTGQFPFLVRPLSRYFHHD